MLCVCVCVCRTKIGQTVFALGAPYGLSSSMSAGVVSGLNRSIPSPVGTRIYGAIQVRHTHTHTTFKPTLGM